MECTLRLGGGQGFPAELELEPGGCKSPAPAMSQLGGRRAGGARTLGNGKPQQNLVLGLVPETHACYPSPRCETGALPL
jgi:hypothetical protein